MRRTRGIGLALFMCAALACADGAFETNDEDDGAAEKPTTADEHDGSPCGTRSDALLGTAGAGKGDRLKQVNGADVSTPEAALEAYACLRNAPNLTLQLTRRGKTQVNTYNIK